MSITVILPDPLRELAGGHAKIELEGALATVGDALSSLRVRYPGVYDRILTEQGRLRPHINVFVGRDDIRWSGGLGTPLAESNEVLILPAVSGG